MLHRLFFAALLCVFAWATADRIAACPLEPVVAAGSGNVCASDAGGSTDSADHHWNALHPASASAHGSVWRSQLVHSELAGVLCPDLFAAVQIGDAHGRRPRLTPLHLRRIPLLI